MRTFYISTDGHNWIFAEDSPYNQTNRQFSGSLKAAVQFIEGEDPQPTNFLWWPELPWSDV